MSVFDDSATVLSRAQVRRVRFLLYGSWDDDDNPMGYLDEEDGSDRAGGDLSPDERAERFAQELARVESPVELHYFAMNYNWDDGEDALRAVLEHPLCDMGTASMIYWLAQPDLLLGWEAEGRICTGPELDDLTFVKRLQDRLLRRDFGPRQIRFDPRNVLGVDYTQPDAGSTGMPLVPGALKEPTPGRELDFLPL
jgi:hypothetical protein